MQVSEKENQLVQLKSELEVSLGRVSAMESELINAQSTITGLEAELSEGQEDLNKAFDRLAKSDSTILDLNEQVTLLQNEV